MSTRPEPLPVRVRAMRESDLEAAGRIFRLAFGTFFNAPDPENFRADRNFSGRWHADPASAWAATHADALVGSNFATIWGSFGFFGPLTVLPEHWNRGVAQALLAPTVERFEAAGARESALFTFAHSPRHVSLYQKFGYWPGRLTALMAKMHPADAGAPSGVAAYSSLPEAQRREALAAVRELCQGIYDGLDPTIEIEAIARLRLGETLLLWGRGRSGSRLAGVAICHCGAGTEAGANSAFIKFGAVRGGGGAGVRLEALLRAAEQLAAARGLGRVDVGVNTAREGAYRGLLALGYKIQALGVAMHRGGSAYNHARAWVLDDWR